MRAVETRGTFDQVIASASPEIQALVIGLRALVVDVWPEVVEVAWPTQGAIGYGVGPKRQSEHFCYIAPQRAYVNLGFNYGARLPDPDGLLEGTGKLFRHVKVARDEEIARSSPRRLLQAAVAERREALGSIEQWATTTARGQRLKMTFGS